MQKNGITAEVRQHPWEIELAGRLTPGAFSLPGNVSSQYVSGLMLALPLLTGPSEIRLTGALESAGYAGMTEEMLRRFGLKLEKIPMGKAPSPTELFSRCCGRWAPGSSFPRKG